MRPAHLDVASTTQRSFRLGLNVMSDPSREVQPHVYDSEVYE